VLDDGIKGRLDKALAGLKAEFAASRTATA
jgi:hypothetical protein